MQDPEVKKAFEELAVQVLEANLRLQKSGLAPLTWGNASALDSTGRYMLIKPSGVPYETMKESDLVLLEVETGKQVLGDKRPSSDTPTHLEIYRSFKGVKGVVHTHSRFATVFAQLGREIPPFGTTHADHFYGSVPCARALTKEEVEGEYELNTGKVIAETFKDLDPIAVPGVLVKEHGPFTWGSSAKQAVDNAVALEQIAEMAWRMLALDPDCSTIDDYLLEKHYGRKHGKNAYYGQR